MSDGHETRQLELPADLKSSAATGEIRVAPLADIVRLKRASSSEDQGIPFADTRFEYLRSITNPRTGVKHVLAGSREGDIVICDAT